MIAAAACLGACSLIGFPHDSTEGFSTAKYGPAAPRAVSFNETDIPKGGGHYMVGDPYRVAGKTYVPRDDPKYSQVGVASWYGYDFHGRETANGEIYDLDGVTAAHPTMPLPSYARVTNLENGKSIEVRVNDRGPFVDGRIIDVSRTVARMLDFEDEGTAKVKVDYIGPAPLDGDDTKMLLASYKDPTGAPVGGSSPILVAATPAPAAPALAAPVPAPAAIPPQLSRAVGPVQAASVISAPPSPRPAPANDPIAPLILRSGLSYSEPQPAQPLTPAQQAAEQLARADLSNQLAIAAAKKAAELAAASSRSGGTP